MKLFLCPNGFTDLQAEQARACIYVLKKKGINVHCSPPMIFFFIKRHNIRLFCRLKAI